MQLANSAPTIVMPAQNGQLDQRPSDARTPSVAAAKSPTQGALCRNQRNRENTSVHNTIFASYPFCIYKSHKSHRPIHSGASHPTTFIRSNDKFSAISRRNCLPDVLFPLKSSVHAQKAGPPSHTLFIDSFGLRGTKRSCNTLGGRL